MTSRTFPGMDCIFFLKNKNELNISLSMDTCAKLKQDMEKQKRYVKGNGERPGHIGIKGPLCITAKDSLGPDAWSFFAKLKERSLFYYNRAYKEDTVRMEKLTVRQAEAPKWSRWGNSIELDVSPQDWACFCDALDRFVKGCWYFQVELSLDSLVVSFSVHELDADPWNTCIDGLIN